MKIFTFWEPKNKIPDYLKLCMKTWEKFIPDAEVHILDFSNIFDYIDITPYGKKLFSGAFSLPQIADAIRAMLLEKYGGIWMDVDTIILRDDINKYIREDRDITFFGYSDSFSPHICWIRAKKNAPLLKHWVNTNIKKISEFSPENVTDDFWAYLGNAVVDPYIETHPDEVDIIDVDKENCMPEHKFGGNNPANYADFHFKKNLHLDDIDSSVVLLHNSWTPKEILEMTADEFLSYDCTMSNILSEALGIDCKKTKFIDDNTDRNRYILHKTDGTVVSYPQVAGLNVTFTGTDGLVELFEPVGVFENSNFICGTNCHIKIGASTLSHPRYGLNIIAIAPYSLCTIGSDFGCYNTQIMLTNKEKLSVTVGDDCQFYSGVRIKPTDEEIIYDVVSDEVVNSGEDIIIGNHVCAESDVLLCSGAYVTDNNVLKTKSRICDKFTDECTCIDGNPAKVVRENVNWHRLPPGEWSIL